jgi:hypothetical protein
VKTNRFREDGPQLVRSFLHTAPATGRDGGGPVSDRWAWDTRLEIHFQTMRRRYVPDAVHGRSLAMIRHRMAQIIEKGGRIHNPRGESAIQERTELRRKSQYAIGGAIEERLDTEGVARQQQPLSRCVKEGKGEHADNTTQSQRARANQQVEQNLRIRVGSEHRAGLLELGTQLRVIVDLAVEYNRVPAARIQHGLPAALRQVENRQPPVHQSHTSAAHCIRLAGYTDDIPIPGEKSDIIRAAMRQRAGQPIKAGRQALEWTPGENAGYAAHRVSPLLRQLSQPAGERSSGPMV